MAIESRETTSLIGSDKVEGTNVYGADQEKIGSIERVMIDKQSGKVAYAIISYGGFLGMGSTLHAIPWNALTLDTAEKCFRVDLDAQRIKDDPGFDKDHWPSMADTAWGTQLHEYYHRRPYWDATAMQAARPDSDLQRL